MVGVCVCERVRKGVSVSEWECLLVHEKVRQEWEREREIEWEGECVGELVGLWQWEGDIGESQFHRNSDLPKIPLRRILKDSRHNLMNLTSCVRLETINLIPTLMLPYLKSCQLNCWYILSPDYENAMVDMKEFVRWCVCDLAVCCVS